MARSKRVLFTFDPRNYNNLRELTDSGGFQSASDAVRDALHVARALQKQAQQGFTEILVRNPQTHQERMIVLPHFDAPALDERQSAGGSVSMDSDQTADTEDR
jgi:Arc/MetJ-type ribon-helix-helix transcriptional regulator